MTPNTENIEARLCAYIDGELDADGRAEIERHLDANPQHRQLIGELTRQRDMMHTLPRETAPAELREAIEQQLERSMLLGRAEDGGAEAVLLKIRRWPQITAAAAIVTLTVGLGVVVYKVVTPPPPKPQLTIATPPPQADVVPFATEDFRAARDADDVAPSAMTARPTMPAAATDGAAADTLPGPRIALPTPAELLAAREEPTAVDGAGASAELTLPPTPPLAAAVEAVTDLSVGATASPDVVASVSRERDVVDAVLDGAGIARLDQPAPQRIVVVLNSTASRPGDDQVMRLLLDNGLTWEAPRPAGVEESKSLDASQRDMKRDGDAGLKSAVDTEHTSTMKDAQPSQAVGEGRDAISKSFKSGASASKVDDKKLMSGQSILSRPDAMQMSYPRSTQQEAQLAPEPQGVEQTQTRLTLEKVESRDQGQNASVSNTGTNAGRSNVYVVRSVPASKARAVVDQINRLASPDLNLNNPRTFTDKNADTDTSQVAPQVTSDLPVTTVAPPLTHTAPEVSDGPGNERSGNTPAAPGPKTAGVLPATTPTSGSLADSSFQQIPASVSPALVAPAVDEEAPVDLVIVVQEQPLAEPMFAPDIAPSAPDTGATTPSAGAITPDTGATSPDTGIQATEDNLVAPQSTAPEVPPSTQPAP